MIWRIQIVSDKSNIKEKHYFDGRVRSLELEEGGKKFSTGIVLPGEYDFGVAKDKETIRVTFETLNINGVDYSPSSEPCVIEPGEKIVIKATSSARYSCNFG